MPSLRLIGLDQACLYERDPTGQILETTSVATTKIMSNRIITAKKLIILEKFEEAKIILEDVANENNMEAQLILGYLYYGGDLNTSPAKAKYWLKRSAKNGNADAMYYLATTDFDQGSSSTEMENEESFALLTKAAKKGSAEAQRNLAVIYAHGETVIQDNIQTMYWDEQAANQGLAESQHDLAAMLLYGDNGASDVSKAIFWYQKSAEKNHNVPYAQWAAEALERIYSDDSSAGYLDMEKSKYWADRAKFLETVDGRAHPDWFYSDL